VGAAPFNHLGEQVGTADPGNVAALELSKDHDGHSVWSNQRCIPVDLKEMWIFLCAHHAMNVPDANNSPDAVMRPIQDQVNGFF